MSLLSGPISMLQCREQGKATFPHASAGFVNELSLSPNAKKAKSSLLCSRAIKMFGLDFGTSVLIFQLYKAQLFIQEFLVD